MPHGTVELRKEFRVKDEGRNSRIVEAEPGCIGKQSPTFYRYDLWDPEVRLKIAEIFATGAEKYGEDNWKFIPAPNHINKAQIHIDAHLAGDRRDDHLLHAAWRIMAAFVIERDGVKVNEDRTDNATESPAGSSDTIGLPPDSGTGVSEEQNV